MSRCLILSCSKKKRPDPGDLPALARYDGPPFRVLRRFLRQFPADSLSVCILSTQFGLIPGAQMIPYYDRRMTASRAHQLRESVLNSFKEVIEKDSPGSLCINLGREYMRAFEGYEKFLSPHVECVIVRGSQGKRLSQLWSWLYRDSGKQLEAASIQTGPSQIRGVQIDLSPEEVLDLARNALRDEPEGHQAHVSWYVDVDGVQVSAKWLVSKISGLPRGAFTTTDARRVLGRLDIEVLRA